MNLGAWILVAAVMQPGVGPVAPAGANETFQQTTRAVYEAMAAGDWTRAEALARRLPKKTVRISYDDREVPAEWKAVYREAALTAIERWKSFYPELDIRMEGGDDVRISFTDVIPGGEPGTLPLGSAVFFSDDASEPRVDLVIARFRLDPAQPTNPQMVTHEVAYGIGSFLGLAQSARPGGAMGRTDLNLRNTLNLTPQEPALAKALVAIGDALRAAVAEKKVLEMPEPRVAIDPLRIELPPMRQGDRVPFSFQISNSGNAPSGLSLVPDCGCFGVRQPGTVAAGGSVLVEGLIDTAQFPGPFRKAIYVYSSDPEIPVRRVEFVGHVAPAYRYFMAGNGIHVARRGGESVTIYFWSDPANPVTISGAEPLGPGSRVRVEPWEGTMADPGMGEPNPLPRKGYKFTFVLPQELPVGRNSFGFNVQTPNALLARLPFTFMVQKGIVAFPERVYFGSIPRRPAAAWVMLSRPGQPFKVLEVTSDNPSFVPSIGNPAEGEDVRIDVRFTGNANPGSILANITAKTNDPDQPLIRIPITGTVE